MAEEPRRSSRTNKGQHTGRDLFDVYYKPEDEPPAKRHKGDAEYSIDQAPGSESDEDLQFEKGNNSDANEEGEVRCDPCGTTQDNYDEETDEGGTMIECDKCRTWQHARCMGFRSETLIPDKYNCNRCAEPQQNVLVSRRRPSMEKKIWKKPTSASSAATKTRESVEKALKNVIVKHGKFDADSIAKKLEEAVFQWSGLTPNKKYIDKSRSVMALVKKEAVASKLADGSLSFLDAVSKPPEEIDRDLKEYAEKVRQESIRRSVLVVEDPLSQRIRRTHKGEEVVETSNNPLEAEDVSLIARTVDHRKFKEESPTPRETIKTDPLAPKVYHYADDDEDEKDAEPQEDHENAEPQDEKKKNDDLSDDELDFILKGPSTPQPEKPKPAPVKEQPKVKLPPTMPVKFWSGEIVFPDFAAFDAKAEFISCTKYQKPKDNVTVSFHNRVIRVSKELLERPKYLIEGRLDRSRADPYLSKITTSRDLYVVKLNPVDRQEEFHRLYDYLLQKNKVGVLSNRAACAKDAYVFALNSKNVPEYLNFANLGAGEGLYAIFVVKKDYIPVGKSILKKSPSTTQPQMAPSQPPADLNSILLKLSGISGNNSAPQMNHSGPHSHQQQHPSHLPPIPPQYGQFQEPQNLSQDQINYLSNLVNQNPHVQQNPQALLHLLHLAEQGGHNPYR
uniref:Transcription factor BYE1 n=1 Tax=Candidozyma auris TaxID=498019 RepID=A0A0L0P886_CANAR